MKTYWCDGWLPPALNGMNPATWSVLAEQAPPRPTSVYFPPAHYTEDEIVERLTVAVRRPLKAQIPCPCHDCGAATMRCPDCGNEISITDTNDVWHQADCETCLAGKSEYCPAHV